MAISPQRLTIYLYSAHRAVIFAVAQLSCLSVYQIPHMPYCLFWIIGVFSAKLFKWYANLGIKFAVLVFLSVKIFKQLKIYYCRLYCWFAIHYFIRHIVLPLNFGKYIDSAAFSIIVYTVFQIEDKHISVLTYCQYGLHLFNLSFAVSKSDCKQQHPVDLRT